jgi:hypothetical protein
MHSSFTTTTAVRSMIFTTTTAAAAIFLQVDCKSQSGPKIFQSGTLTRTHDTGLIVNLPLIRDQLKVWTFSSDLGM